MFLTLVILLLVLIVIQLVSVVFKQYCLYQSFKNRGIPGPKPNYFWGNFLEFRKYRNTNIILDEWIKKYGDILGYIVGLRKWILIKDLDMIQEVFIKNLRYVRNREPFVLDLKHFRNNLVWLRDDRWKNMRKKISPSFSAHNIECESSLNMIEESTKKLIKHLENSCCHNPVKNSKSTSTQLEIFDLMQSFTMDVIARTSFEIDEDIYNPNSALMKNSREFLKNFDNLAVELCCLFPFLKMILSLIQEYMSCSKMIEKLVLILKSHIKEMISSQSTVIENKDKKGNKSLFLRNLLQRYAAKEITEGEFIDNTLGIFLAGFETTANATTFTLYLLATNQHIQEKLREDLKEHGINSKYLEQVWLESLRLFPPVCLFITREISEDVVINGFKFVKNDTVQIPIWAIHHDPEIWPEPYKFDPDRFSEENRATMHPCQFLSFGLGSRVCVGVSFAHLEAKIMLRNLLLNFRLETNDKTPENLKLYMNSVVINPAQPINLTFIKL